MQTRNVYSEVGDRFLNIRYTEFVLLGRTIAQLVSRRPLSSQTWVRTRASPSELVVNNVEMIQVSLPVLYKHSGRSLETFKQNSALSEIGDSRNKGAFHFFVPHFSFALLQQSTCPHLALHYKSEGRGFDSR
jgi:hypothetical protein